MFAIIRSRHLLWCIPKNFTIWKITAHQLEIRVINNFRQLYDFLVQVYIIQNRRITVSDEQVSHKTCI